MLKKIYINEPNTTDFDYEYYLVSDSDNKPYVKIGSNRDDENRYVIKYGINWKNKQDSSYVLSPDNKDYLVYNSMVYLINNMKTVKKI